MLYERVLRPLLFRLDAEAAHQAVSAGLSALQALPGGSSLLSGLVGRPPAGLSVEAFGLRFPNPLGLAAGFDKDARLVRVLPALGFGFLEAGSITLRPQPGNPKPRVWRVTEEKAIINRLGFNSRGAAAAAEALARVRFRQAPLGLNLGLNADCPPNRAPEEYAAAFKLLAPHGDYFVVNVSSPNTKGLRDLQQAGRLSAVLKAIAAENAAKKPVLVKLSPDIADDDLPEILAALKPLAAGVVVSNTTTSRAGIPEAFRETPGGLSGPPLRERSTRLIRLVHSLTGGALPIIGVGGVHDGDSAFEKILAGASLLQMYTGLVYGGPSAAVSILRGLSRRLEAAGYASVAAAVGREALP